MASSFILNKWKSLQDLPKINEKSLVLKSLLVFKKKWKLIQRLAIRNWKKIQLHFENIKKKTNDKIYEISI